MNKFAIVLFLGLVSFSQVYSAKILFLLPYSSKSHVHVFEPLVRALGQRGHEVTNMSPVNSSGMPPSVKQVVTLTIPEIFVDFPDPFYMRQQGRWKAFTNMSTEYMENACKGILNHPAFQEVLDNQTFDVIVVDILLNYCVLGVVDYYKAPTIYVSTMVAPSYITEVIGNRLPSSFVPNPFLEFTQNMTFKERTINFLFEAFCSIMNLFFLPKFEKLYMDKFGTNATVSEISSNISMIFMNSHFTLTYPRPLLPDIVEIGGMHAGPAKPLPKEMDEFLSGAKDGFILFSLGSIVQAKTMPDSYRKIFVNVFSRLKQRVIWKWEEETMEDLPPNVKLSKWLPQQDILGHKNIKLFMTHGGLLSIQETVYHGVPLLGIPLFADQDLNVKQAEKAGFAIYEEILEMTEESLESKLRKILDDPQYDQRAKELSTVWRDQPLTPLDTAVFWTEYVIRHKGAPHLRSAARDLNAIQYHSFDVMTFVATVLIVILYISKCVFMILCRKLCTILFKTKSKTTTVKKNN